jgi:type IVB pilus formation R64 PilN family outer membrane protein
MVNVSTRKAASLMVPATAVLLAGCTGLSQRVGNDFAKQDAKASSLVRDVGRTAPGVVAKTEPQVVNDKGIWLGKNIVKVGQPSLPPVFFEPATFDRSVGSLSEVVERITLRSGIPTKVSADALAVASSILQGGSGTQPGVTAGVGPDGQAIQPRVPPIPMSAFGAVQPRQPAQVRIVYTSGNFKGLLDTVAARFGVYWKYSDGVIQFFHTDSRTFQVNAIPGDASLTASVNSGATSTGGVTGGAGGGAASSTGSTGVSANNTQNTAVASRLSVYSSIEKSVAAMLSSYGKVVSSPATGTITVVDTPDALERVASFIDNENKTLSRQVVINVTVLSVSLNESDEYGINWDLVYNTLNAKYGIRNTVAASTNAVGFSAGILSTSTSKFAGSTVLINALSDQGKVRRQTTASVVTLNNQPVPVQVARQTSYLQSSQTTVTAQVGTTTSLIPGTVTSGFNMSILPHVLANGTVMLQFSTDISALRSIRTVTSNGSTIESPEMDTRNFLQRVAMKSNETLVISGFEQTDENTDNSGVGHPANFLFGGGIKANSNKEVIVILITPTMVSGS